MSNLRKKVWQLQEAKSRFSELVKHAQENGPQFVTKNGSRAVVVVASDEWDKLSKKNLDLAEFFRRSPLAREKVEFTRARDYPREIEI